MEAIASSSRMKSNNKQIFNPLAFRDSASVVRRVMQLGQLQQAYAQGDPASSVMYIQEGKVKLSVVNEVGKEAIIALLGPGDFFGEDCLVGQSSRMGTATALTPTTVVVIQKDEMTRAMSSERAFADRFMAYLLSRKLRTEEDLINQMLNCSEKRLARALLLLTGYGKQEPPQKELPNISQEMLAELIGTTRSRVNLFMNKFRRLGFLEYEGGLQINPSLLNVLRRE
jgi:CRP/FNR family cyclic AMP-dependent transcriptional regulator